MNCCIECFHDTQIRDMIRTNNESGNCSFCGKEGVPIYSLDEQSDLSDLISKVLFFTEHGSVAVEMDMTYRKWEHHRLENENRGE